MAAYKVMIFLKMREEDIQKNQQLDLAGLKPKNFCLNTRQPGTQHKNINTRNYFKSQ
jgi:hypothetical protein